MQQVVMNLAVNARDAMPGGGKLVIETLLVGTENGASNGLPADRGGFVKLSVSDTGTGMDSETQQRIFDPFFTTKESGKGTGLGLYIVHAVVSNHGGYINLYSEPGKGTRFSIHLPYTRGLAPEAPPAPEDLRGSGTVLVIDDEAHIRELCKDMLEPLGYAVLLAAGSEEGVRMYRARKEGIALVVLDMIMPKTGGSEVFQTLKTIKPDVKVLLCSGYSNSGFAGIDTLLKNGALGFIQKPFSLQAFAGAIKNALSGKPPKT
jgi:CheY-like chemotaxis protein